MAKRKVDMRDFEILKVLGTGAYGKVCCCLAHCLIQFFYLVFFSRIRYFLYVRLAAPITESCTQ